MEVGQTNGSHEDMCLAHITREILWKAPSILRTRNHVHCIADYVVSSTCPRNDLHRSDGIKTARLKGYGLRECSVEFVR